MNLLESWRNWTSYQRKYPQQYQITWEIHNKKDKVFCAFSLSCNEITKMIQILWTFFFVIPFLLTLQTVLVLNEYNNTILCQNEYRFSPVSEITIAEKQFKLKNSSSCSDDLSINSTLLSFHSALSGKYHK